VNQSDRTEDRAGVPDFITEQWIETTPQEQVCQRVARFLVVELGVDPSQIVRNVVCTIGKTPFYIDVAVASSPTTATLADVTHAVVCRSPVKSSHRRRIDSSSGDKTLDALQQAMLLAPNCFWGAYTDGVNTIYLEKTVTADGIQFNQGAQWSHVPYPGSALKSDDPEDFRRSLLRRLNEIYTHEGASRDVLFWDIVYLLACKLLDERKPAANQQFWIHPGESHTLTGRQEICRRLRTLFEAVQAQYPSEFTQSLTFSLSDTSLVRLADEFSRFHLTQMGGDLKGILYQAIVSSLARSDRAQFFTPRGVVQLAIQIIAPAPHESILDPTCGTGGFLSGALSYWQRQGLLPTGSITGIELDRFLARAAHWNLMLQDAPNAKIICNNALATEILQQIPPASVDVIFSNPPYGINVAVKDATILRAFELAHTWKKQVDRSWTRTDQLQASVVPEILCVEQCVRWLKPGGRMALVLPNGFLSNASAEYARTWLMQRCWILASISIPVEAFLVEANVGIHTGVLILQKKTELEIKAEAAQGTPDYAIFMAVADKVGVDRRGNPIYKRDETGQVKIAAHRLTQTIRRGDDLIEREIQWDDRVRDDDLPSIAEAYLSMRLKHPLPGRLLAQPSATPQPPRAAIPSS